MSTSWATIPDLIDDAAERFGDREAIADGGLSWNFAEFRTEIRRAAAALQASGIEAGDRVAIWAPNCWEWAVAALGVHVAGGIVVPINTRFKGREAAYVMEASQARVLFTVTDFLDTDYVSLLTEAGLPAKLKEIVVLRGSVPETATDFASFMDRAGEVDAAAVVARAENVGGDDLCNIMFTSGTTGAPKGAMLTHSATCRGYKSWSDVIGLDRDRYLIINPFFHSFGLNAGILACLMTGSTILPHPVFDVPSVMARIPVDRVSMLPGPPAIYQTILNHPDLDTFDMSTLRLAVTGAAAIPVEMIVQMRERLGFEKVVTGYGLTETTGIATMCRHTDDPEVIATTSGRAIPDVEVRIVDPDGEETPRGEPGEIVVRGYNVMVGYLDDPEKTAETIDADGWLHTGDIGVMDAGRQHRHHRSGEGHVHQRWLQRLSGRDREPDARAPRHRECRRDRRARRSPGRGRLRLCGSRSRDIARPRRDHRLVSSGNGQLQVPAPCRDRRFVATQRQQQGVEVRASRSGDRCPELKSIRISG